MWELLPWRRKNTGGVWKVFRAIDPSLAKSFRTTLTRQYAPRLSSLSRKKFPHP